jgi:hypothetical protein
VADGENRQFSYEEPRPGMVEAGAHLGSVLFTGKSRNGSYVGTAYIFNSHCGQIPYQVRGPILDRHERVVLKGQAPRVDSDCNIVGYVSDILEFSLFKSAKTTPNVLRSYVTPAPLNKAANLKVVNKGANDILTIREYPTEDSRVIDIIPPDGTGIVYMRETHGPWVFVRYERADGWVNRVFVEPIVSPGRRLR